MLNNNIRLNNNMINKANAAYDKYANAIAELRNLGFEVVNPDEIFQDTKEENVAPIVINKGHIVEVQTIKEVKVTDDELIEELKMQLDIAKEEIAYYHDVEKDYINDVSLFQEEISNLKDELEIKEGVLNHMKKVHKCEIEELEDKIKELNRRIKALQMFNDAEDEIFEEQETMKGGDAVKAQPEQPKRNPLLDKIKKAKEFTLEEAAAEAQAEAEQKAKDKEEAKSKFPKYTLEYHELTFDKSIDSRTMFGIYGTITFDEASYKFEATNNHHMPIVYACYDEEVIRLTKEIIMHEVERFSFMNERENGAASYAHINDAEFPLVVWRLTDDKGNVTYHGYGSTKQYDYVLTWDKKKFNYVGRKLVKNLFTDQTNAWKKLANEKHADKFRAVCASTWPEDFTNDDNDPEPTKDKKQHKNTKEQHKNTNDKIFRVTKESDQNTKEFHQITNEQHQNTKESYQITNDKETKATNEGPVVYNGPMDNIGKTFGNTNDEGFDAAAEEIDF
jgi:hypothetical protein